VRYEEENTRPDGQELFDTSKQIMIRGASRVGLKKKKAPEKGCFDMGWDRRVQG